MEQWKDIIGFEGSYQVSNIGRVKSLAKLVPIANTGRFRDEPERILSSYQGDAYLSVLLSKGSIKKRITIHRLVALHFIKPVAGKNYINHKDANTHNNHVSNLEWCTQSENKKYSYQIGRSVPTMNRKGSFNNENSKPILQYSKTGTFLKEWPSSAEAARSFQKNAANISCCLRGVSKTAFGYKWSFK